MRTAPGTLAAAPTGEVEAVELPFPPRSPVLGFGDLSASMALALRPRARRRLHYPGDIWSAHRVRMIAACPTPPSTASLGAVGKWCIHPNQTPLANDVLAPSPRETAQAQKTVDLYNESVAKGAGAGRKGGQLLDATTSRIYEPVLERARATGEVLGCGQSHRRAVSSLARSQPRDTRTACRNAGRR